MQNEDKRDSEFKKSLNYEYNFLNIDQLETFKLQYYRSVNILIMRMYKQVFSLH